VDITQCRVVKHVSENSPRYKPIPPSFDRQLRSHVCFIHGSICTLEEVPHSRHGFSAEGVSSRAGCLRDPPA
jgi:hypothetical protein